MRLAIITVWHLFTLQYNFTTKLCGALQTLQVEFIYMFRKVLRTVIIHIRFIWQNILL